MLKSTTLNFFGFFVSLFKAERKIINCKGFLQGYPGQKWNYCNFEIQLDSKLGR